MLLEMSEHTLRELLLAGAVALTLAALWSTPLGAPVRIAVVGLHELGHAGAALLSGGEVLHVAVRPTEVGETLSRGGWRAFILWAGYPVPLAIGAALLGRPGRGGWMGDLLGLLLLAGGWADVLGDLRAARSDATALLEETELSWALWWLSWVIFAGGATGMAVWRRSRRISTPGRREGGRTAPAPRGRGPRR